MTDTRSFTAYLGLGANIGDPQTQLREAQAQLNAQSEIEITKVSSTLVNPAWGNTDQPPFSNMVIEISTTLTPGQLLAACQRIENDMGRERTTHWGPRNIDIDIIAFEQEVISSQDLTLPHPFAAERVFVMSPLREIASPVADWIYKLANARR